MRDLELEFSTWTEKGERGGDDKGGVSEAGEEGTAVDVIKLLAKDHSSSASETSKRQLGGTLYKVLLWRTKEAFGRGIY